MRSSVYHRHSTGPLLSPLVMIAAASFLAGFGGYLLFGLTSLN
jgi:hypothetical protein